MNKMDHVNSLGSSSNEPEIEEKSSLVDGQDLFSSKIFSGNSLQSGSATESTQSLSPKVSSSSFLNPGESLNHMSSNTRDDKDYVDNCATLEQKSEFSAPLESQLNEKLLKIAKSSYDSNIVSSQNLHKTTDEVKLEFYVQSKDLDVSGQINSTTDKSNISSSTLKDDEVLELYHMDRNGDIWMPPAPAFGIDILTNIAYDEDDEYNNGIKWKRSNTFGISFEDFSVEFNLKEKRQKATEAVRVGKFRSIVSKLLLYEGFITSGSLEIWLDVVASLSWEAAQIIKPNANKGKEMYPGHYLKVKCVSSGSPTESQVIKGLVFKKNAAHKHMPSKYNNPRLLLLKDVIGQHSAEFESLQIVEKQERRDLVSISKMIELCNPNVVLVEKNVARDVQEILLKRGITLVCDMKSHRLNRIAHCTGSKIAYSYENLMNLELKQCDSFHIDKFVKEHGISGGEGKPPSKTLMFFEGCPKPLACTILLKGSHNKELKKVKRVLPCAVSVAYHLILEASFLVDQELLVCKTPTNALDDQILVDHTTPIANTNELNVYKLSNFSQESSLYTLDIPVSDGTQELSLGEDLSPFSELASEGNDTHLSDFQRNLPLQRRFDNNEIETQSEFKEKYAVEAETNDFHALPILFSEELDSDEELNGRPEQMMSNEIGKKTEPLLTLSSVPLKPSSCISVGNFDWINAENIRTAINFHSILVLSLCRCLLTGTVCEKSHLLRINFYGDFDVSLGWYLRNNLLNQNHRCSSCNKPPIVHAYSYIHQNVKVSIIVNQLPESWVLPGESEGRLWMWTRCLKCQHQNWKQKISGRVALSNIAQGISFGKFLELSFTNYSKSNCVASCGHLLYRDCLHFYGLGGMVTIFRHSPLEIYTANMPSHLLEFNNLNRHEWIEREAKKVLEKANFLFTEIAQLLISRGQSNVFIKQNVNCASSSSEVVNVEGMLKKEKYIFDSYFQKAINMGKVGKTGLQILYLNCLNQDLMLALYVWDLRLNTLSLSNGPNRGDNLIHTYESHPTVTVSDDKMSEQISFQPSGEVVGKLNHVDITVNQSLPSNYESLWKHSIRKGEPLVPTGNTDIVSILDTLPDDAMSKKQSISYFNDEKQDVDILVDRDSTVSFDDHSFPLEVQLESVQSILPSSDGSDTLKLPLTSEQNCPNEYLVMKRIPSEDGFKEQQGDITNSPSSDLSNSNNFEQWIWNPFTEILKEYRKYLLGEHSDKFSSINSHTPLHLSMPISHEFSRLNFAVGKDEYVVSLHDSEYSSIIACALALSEAKYLSMEEIESKEPKQEKDETDVTLGMSCRIASGLVNDSLHSSSTNSPESQGTEQRMNYSSECLSPGSEHVLYVNPIVSSETLHPEIALGDEIIPGRNKYSVTCIHAKQFYVLRRRCCPCELDYISSLSRCRKWDAKGGKSKAFFAKTMDERFIIKEIKEVELESFLKFAPEYFHYLSYSLKSGSQTCLAKILGIYRVTIRPTKTFKEVKMDLMVMENVVWGENISTLYDLKGALHSRYTPDPSTGDVLLDQNFVDDMLSSPLYISGRSNHRLQRGIWNDTSFLTSINVMDYSLLVGVDKQQNKLVVGIIDYLRQYTWDKQLETWVKASLVVPKNSLPTVISPKDYKKRFRKFMSTYFLAVPDNWCSGK